MDIAELTARRDGVFSTREARDCGVSSSTIHRKLAAGDWKAVARGVYLVAGHPRTARAQARIAVLSVHTAAVLGGAAAAWWLGLHDDEPRKHVVYTPTRGTARRSSATALVGYRPLHAEDITIHQGLPTTAAALTVLDASLDIGISILDSALLTTRVTLDALHAAHDRYPNRHGAPRVATYLRLLGDGARSEAERLTTELLTTAGITGWIANMPTLGHVIDFAFPDTKIAVEIDGFAFHRDVATFQRDRTKRNLLTANGWTVLNFTWTDLIERPAQVATAIHTALHRSAA
ncbi:type IV toxin-antitoxin system AbiEi family antitoxin domain-containing protein [Gordonia McavH-238-E]|uniref:type IV toxin-antitoxin system AbiEi family antitoxin domain-containing protein n=1 Tax=Gordonia sp. McavH-238-E TaxID=2917736 RepID=UPI001EF54012|nr:type IV toxin-antitoxin system AbiEi family antitoxin domain-containing protein [Gordonia sp. McavH-238-E]MCG7634857.1 type IV toxin-antitoxin system AbiEi family antitoxin domain-containing protein [Gordonia sp. McavH-238-E]